MFTKSFSRKDIRDIMDDKFQNLMAFKFIMRYLSECHERNKKLLRGIKKTQDDCSI